MRRSIPCLAFCLAVSVAVPAFAQSEETSPCRVDSGAWLSAHAEALDGFWLDETVLSTMDGMPMPLPAPEAAGIEWTGTALRLSVTEYDQTYDLALTERDFALDPPDGVDALDQDAIEVLLGCPVNDLPRFVGEGTHMRDGHTITRRLAAVLASTTEIHIWSVYTSPSFPTIVQQSVLNQ